MYSLSTRVNVIYAVILRDIRTRFGRSYLGYLIALAWPLTHMTVLVLMLGIWRNTAPIGGDSAVFVTSGVIPYILCLYPARMMGNCIDQNRALFVFPIVQAFDLMVARAVVEFLSAFLVLIIFFIGATASGLNLLPNDLTTGATAVLATVYFSLCLGFLNIVLLSLTNFWNVGFAVLMIILYLTAGVFNLPQFMSEEARQWMSYNPLFHCVEWMRSAYYEGYGDALLSKSYLLWYGTVCLLLGLSGERFLRGKLLAP